MAEEATNLVEEAAHEMDQALASVMPDSWLGHARIDAHGEDLSDKEQEFALKLTQRLVEKKDVPASKALEAAIPHAKEKVE